MAIRISCPSCGMKGQVPDKFANQKVKCKCGMLMLVPAAVPGPGNAPAAPTGITGARATGGAARPAPAAQTSPPSEVDQNWSAITAPSVGKRKSRSKSRGVFMALGALLLIGAGAAAAVFVMQYLEKAEKAPAGPAVAQVPSTPPAITSRVEQTKAKTVSEQGLPSKTGAIKPAIKSESAPGTGVTRPKLSPDPDPAAKKDEAAKPQNNPIPPPTAKTEKPEAKATPAVPPSPKEDQPKLAKPPDSPPPVKVDKTVPKTPEGPPLTPQALFKKASPAVVKVEALGTLSHQGSGFFVTADGVVATNYHMIKDASRASIVTNDGGRYKVEGILNSDVEADLVLLKVTGKDFPTLELADPELPEVGTKAYAIGNPQGLANTFSDGQVSGHREMGNNVTFIQTTAPISGGSSGGPLLSATCKVLGITTAMIPGGQNLNLVAPVARLAKLLKEPGSLRALPGPSSEVTLRWRLKLDDAFYIDFAESRGNKMTSPGQMFEPQDSTETMLAKLKVTEINEDGFVVEMRIEQFKLKTSDKRQEGLAKLLDKLTGAVFTVTLTRQHGVLRIEGLQEMLKKIIDQGDAETQKQFAFYSFEATLHKMLGETFNFGPFTGSAMKGDSWQHKAESDWGSLGSFVIARAYKCEGRDDDGVKIAIKEEYKYRVPRGGAAQDPDIKISGGDFKVEESKGALLFNSKARRLERMDFKTRVAGQLQGTIQGAASVITLQIETATMIRVFDKK